ncbi:hypothetical protein JNM87_05500 [Candidatus Saccharibacteria bacterium]|nr:hypothetical protein [Candidatus Saccharibacteria bacterium]
MPPVDVPAQITEPAVDGGGTGVVAADNAQSMGEVQGADDGSGSVPEVVASTDAVPVADSSGAVVIAGDANALSDAPTPPVVAAEPEQEGAASAAPEPPAVPETPAEPAAAVVPETTPNNAVVASESSQPATATVPMVAAAAVQNGQADAPAAEVGNGVQPVPTEAREIEQPVVLPVAPPTTPSSRVLELTDAELKEAAALYLKRHQAEIAAKGVAKRQAIMGANLDKIVAYLGSASSPQTVAQIARACSITPRTTASYMQKLVHANRIKASGHAGSRRYWAGGNQW